MFGIIRRRKPIIHAHWYVPLSDFQSDTELFYRAVEEELVEREVPDMVVEIIHFREGSHFTANRKYLRFRQERAVLDICSAPFGTGWWFSVRAATLPRILRWWEVGFTALGLAGFFALYVELYGLVVGGVLLGSSLAFGGIVFLAGSVWANLDEFLIYLPVAGALYEAYFRRDTYYRQDQRLMFGDILCTVIRRKVGEFCMAGGIENPEFVSVSSPDQILTQRELAKYLAPSETRPLN